MRSTVATSFLAACAFSASALAGDPLIFRLTAQSEFIHERCLPPCACPASTVSGPMQGRWTLIPVEEEGILFRFDAYILQWSAFATSVPRTITGVGEYSVGGFSGAQRFFADLSIDGAAPVRFDSGSDLTVAPPPRIEIDTIAEPSVCQRITLAVRAIPTCEADLNGDGVVNFADLNEVLSSFGAAGQPGLVRGDANTDGATTFADLNLVLSTFGSPC